MQFTQVSGSFSLRQPATLASAAGSFSLKKNGYTWTNWSDWVTGTGSGISIDRSKRELTIANGGEWISPIFDMANWTIGTWDGWALDAQAQGMTPVVSVQFSTMDAMTDPPNWVSPNASASNLPVKRYMQARIFVNGGSLSVARLALFWKTTLLLSAPSVHIKCAPLSLTGNAGSPIVTTALQNVRSAIPIKNDLTTVTIGPNEVGTQVVQNRTLHQAVEYGTTTSAAPTVQTLNNAGSDLTPFQLNLARSYRGFTSAPNQTIAPAFDQDGQTYWDSGTAANTGVFVGQDFGVGSAKQIRYITFFQGAAGPRWCAPFVRVDASNDNATWVNILTPTRVPVGTNVFCRLNLAANNGYRYWRMVADSGTLNNDEAWQLNMVHMFDTTPSPAVWSGQRLYKEFTLPYGSDAPGGKVFLEIGLSIPSLGAADPLAMGNIGPVMMSLNDGAPIDIRPYLSIDRNSLRCAAWVPVTDPFLAGKNTLEVWGKDIEDESLIASIEAMPGGDSGLSIANPSGPTNVIPIMTSNTAPSGLAFTNAPMAGYEPWRAFDHQGGDDGTIWASPSVADGVTLGYQFPVPTQITSYVLQARNNVSYTNQMPSSWTLQGSNDGATWIDLDARTGQDEWASAERRGFVIATPQPLSMYRLLMHANNGSTSNYSVAEFELQQVQPASRTVTPLSGSLRFALEVPLPRPIEELEFYASVPASANIIKPYYEKQATANIVQTGSVLLAATVQIVQTGFKSLNASALTSRPSTDLNASALIVAPLDKAATALIMRPFYALNASVFVKAQSDLPASLLINPYSDKRATALIVRPSVSLNATADIKGTRDLASTALVVQPIFLSGSALIDKRSMDLSATASVVITGVKLFAASADIMRPFKDLKGTAQIGNVSEVNLNASIFVGGDFINLYPASVLVMQPFKDFSASASVVHPYAFLNANALVYKPAVFLQASANITELGSKDVNASADIGTKYPTFLRATANVAGLYHQSLQATVDVFNTIGQQDLQASASVLVLAPYLYLTSFLDIRPYLDLDASALVEKHSVDKQATALVALRRVGNVFTDGIYISSTDAMSVDILTVGTIQANVNDTISIGVQDGDTSSHSYPGVESLAPTPVPVYPAIGQPIPAIVVPTSTNDAWYLPILVETQGVADGGQFTVTDSGPTWRTASDDNASWTPPVKLTNSLTSGETVQWPFLAEVDGDVMVGFETNEDFYGQNNIHIVKTNDIGYNGVWMPVKRLEGVGGSYAGDGKFRFTGQDGVYEWQPPTPGRDVYEQETPFWPTQHKTWQQIDNDWEETLYEMEKTGEIVYPPPKWNLNPLLDVVAVAIREAPYLATDWAPEYDLPPYQLAQQTIPPTAPLGFIVKGPLHLTYQYAPGVPSTASNPNPSGTLAGGVNHIYTDDPNNESVILLFKDIPSAIHLDFFFEATTGLILIGGNQ